MTEHLLFREQVLKVPQNLFTCKIYKLFLLTDARKFLFWLVVGIWHNSLVDTLFGTTFNCESKVIWEQFGFALLRLTIGPEKSHPFNQSDTKLKINHHLTTRVFPRHE